MGKTFEACSLAYFLLNQPLYINHLKRNDVPIADCTFNKFVTGRLTERVITVRKCHGADQP